MLFTRSIIDDSGSLTWCIKFLYKFVSIVEVFCRLIEISIFDSTIISIFARKLTLFDFLFIDKTLCFLRLFFEVFRFRDDVYVFGFSFLFFSLMCFWSVFSSKFIDWYTSNVYRMFSCRFRFCVDAYGFSLNVDKDSFINDDFYFDVDLNSLILTLDVCFCLINSLIFSILKKIFLLCASILSSFLIISIFWYFSRIVIV